MGWLGRRGRLSIKLSMLSCVTAKDAHLTRTSRANVLLGRIHMFCPIWHVQYALWLALIDCMLMYGIHCNGFPRPPAQLTSSRRAVAPAALDVGGRLTMGIVQPANYVQRCRLFSTRLPPHPAPRGDARTEVLSHSELLASSAPRSAPPTSI